MLKQIILKNKVALVTDKLSPKKFIGINVTNSNCSKGEKTNMKEKNIIFFYKVETIIL